MRTHQQDLLGRIEQVFTDAGLDTVQASEWGNTGHLYGIDRGTGATVVDVEYDIQSTYGALTLTDADTVTTRLAVGFAPDKVFGLRKSVPEVIDQLRRFVEERT